MIVKAQANSRSPVMADLFTIENYGGIPVIELWAIVHQDFFADLLSEKEFSRMFDDGEVVELEVKVASRCDDEKTG